MITNSTSGVWELDDVYKKVNKGVYPYTGADALFAWGEEYLGRLGLNDAIRYSSPVQIPGTTWSSITASVAWGLATKTDGTLWAWGSNYRGQLGQNDTIDRSSPVQIPGNTWSSITDAGSAPDSYAAYATKTDGTLWAWGDNTKGELGQNNLTRYSSPVQIPGTTWSFVSGAHKSTAAIKTDGTLWTWGENNDVFRPAGQLGHNDAILRSSPVQVPGNTWSSVTTGECFMVATKTDGSLWSWGNNANGRLGQNVGIFVHRSSPVQIPGNTWSSVSAGYQHSLATKTDGTLWSWGSNSYGILGQNNGTQYSSPRQVPGTTWSSVSAGNRHSAAIKTDGTLWSWGKNQYGQLGPNDIIPYSSPIQIPGATWDSVHAGANFSIATQLQ